VVRAKEESLARFADQGPGHINCAQAVLLFALLVKRMDPELITTARYMGGGVAGMGEVCGAVSGAAIALGLRDYEAEGSAGAGPPGSPVATGAAGAGVAATGAAGAETPVDVTATRSALQEMIRAFESEFGGLRCRDLTGCDLTTPEGHDAFIKSGANQRCPSFVSWMFDRLLPLLAPEVEAEPGS
jgi:hypothetical protein